MFIYLAVNQFRNHCDRPAHTVSVFASHSQKRESVKETLSYIWHTHIHTHIVACILCKTVSLSLTHKPHTRTHTRTQKERIRHKEKTVLNRASPPCNPFKPNQAWTPAVRTMASALTENPSMVLSGSSLKTPRQ